jgi:hypothetical protein
VTKQWAVTLSVPVRVPTVAGEVKYALSIAVPATQLQKLVSDLPQGWIAAITDRDGKILARSLGHDEWVGKPMARTGWEITKDVPPGQGGSGGMSPPEGRRLSGLSPHGEHRLVDRHLRFAGGLPSPASPHACVGVHSGGRLLLLATLLAFLMGRRITAIQTCRSRRRPARAKVTTPAHFDVRGQYRGRIMRDTARPADSPEQQTTLMQELNHRVKTPSRRSSRSAA